MKKIICLFIIILLCGCSNNNIKANEYGVMKIDNETVLKEINNKDVYIIDVREEYEYESGHIKNSYNVPLSNISDINKLMIRKDTKIIIYCKSGNRSNKAANILIDMGYTNVYDMGGINNWNYELVTK